MDNPPPTVSPRIHSASYTCAATVIWPHVEGNTHNKCPFRAVQDNEWLQCGENGVMVMLEKVSFVCLLVHFTPVPALVSTLPQPFLSHLFLCLFFQLPYLTYHPPTHCMHGTSNGYHVYLPLCPPPQVLLLSCTGSCSSAFVFLWFLSVQQESHSPLLPLTRSPLYSLTRGVFRSTSAETSYS